MMMSAGDINYFAVPAGDNNDVFMDVGNDQHFFAIGGYNYDVYMTAKMTMMSTRLQEMIRILPLPLSQKTMIMFPFCRGYSFNILL